MSYSLSPWHGHALKCFMRKVSASSDELSCLMTAYLRATMYRVSLECNSKHCVHVLALSLSISRVSQCSYVAFHLWVSFTHCIKPHFSVNYKSKYLGIPYFIDMILFRYHKIWSLKNRNKKKPHQYSLSSFCFNCKERVLYFVT